jgi:hypothetical protein
MVPLDPGAQRLRELADISACKTLGSFEKNPGPRFQSEAPKESNKGVIRFVLSWPGR